MHHSGVPVFIILEPVKPALSLLCADCTGLVLLGRLFSDTIVVSDARMCCGCGPGSLVIGTVVFILESGWCVVLCM